MIKVISNGDLRGNGPIKILYPGSYLRQGDSGMGSIGRIDFAKISGNHLIPMHPHRNDEILSYFRIGTCEHIDSEGYRKTLNRRTLMLMKAGSIFHHEEKVLDYLEGLQIFIRPGKENLKPEVIFLELDVEDSIDEWRLIASPEENSVFQFSSQTWIYDTLLTNGEELHLPDHNGCTYLLSVFKGKVKINGTIELSEKSSIIVMNEDVIISAESDAELVVFVTDENSEIYKGGMFSGNIAE